MWTTTSLSQNKRADVEKTICKYDKRWESQTNSQEAIANARYFASADDLAMVYCFLIFRETKVSPKNT